MSSRCNYVFDAYVVDGFVRSIAFLNIIIIICEIITYFPGIYPRFTSRLLLHNPMKYGTENNDETKRSRLGGEEWWPPLRIKHHHFMCTQAHTPLAPGTRWTCYVETSPDSTSRFARTQPWTNEPLIRERRISCERRRNAFLEDKKKKKNNVFLPFFLLFYVQRGGTESLVSAGSIGGQRKFGKAKKISIPKTTRSITSPTPTSCPIWIVNFRTDIINHRCVDTLFEKLYSKCSLTIRIKLKN